jgi:Flp pilus assembly protein TadG
VTLPRLVGRRLGASDRGSIAPAAPILALILLLLGGLVLDASRQLNARGRAVAYAEEAARAGAGAIELGSIDLQLDEEEARARVQTYCGEVMDGGAVTQCYLVGFDAVSSTDPDRLVVETRVELEIPATLLGLVGLTTLGASGDGRARPLEGVDSPVEPLP